MTAAQNEYMSVALISTRTKASVVVLSSCKRVSMHRSRVIAVG